MIGESPDSNSNFKIAGGGGFYASQLARDIVKGNKSLSDVEVDVQDETVLRAVKQILKAKGFEQSGSSHFKNKDNIDLNRYFTTTTLAKALGVVRATINYRLQNPILQKRYVSFVRGRGKAGKIKLVDKSIMSDSLFAKNKKVHREGYLIPDNNQTVRLKTMREKTGGFFKKETLEVEQIIENILGKLRSDVIALERTLEIIKNLSSKQNGNNYLDT